MCYQREWELEGKEGKGLEGLPLCDLSTLRPWRGLLGVAGEVEGGATNEPVATSGNEVIAVDWKGLKDVDQIHMDSTSSLHGSGLHRPSTEVRPCAQLPPPPGPKEFDLLLIYFISFLNMF